MLSLQPLRGCKGEVDASQIYESAFIMEYVNLPVQGTCAEIKELYFRNSNTTRVFIGMWFIRPISKIRVSQE